MFVARDKELAILKEELLKNSSATLVYGKRKIGKTTLILEAVKRFSSREVIYYECIKDTIENNVKILTDEMKRLSIMPNEFSFENNTFDLVFSFINGLGKEFVVIIDEYCYLKEYEDSKKVDSLFQNIIDNKLKNINLFISGSHISMMKDLLQEKNALFGRFTCALELKELNYLDASTFCENISSYDKVAFYAVFGGSPFILCQIDYELSLIDNIKRLLLNKSSPVYLYVDSLLLTDMINKSMIDRVLSCLKNSKKHYKELEDDLDKGKTGNLSKMLKPLMEIDLIKKEYPINKLNQERKATYQINDNILRFYYTYIYKRKYLIDKMDSDTFFDSFIDVSLNEFISRRFEDICRDYIWELLKKKKINNIYNVGSYYYDDSINHINGEFDIALDRNDSYDIIEVKYLKCKVSKNIVKKEIDQINAIKEVKVKRIGFISINGFEDDVPSLDYKYDGDDLYKL